VPYEEDLELNPLPLREADVAPLPPPSGAASPEVEDLRALVRACLEDMKAEDAVEIDLAGKTSIADTMIIASGRSHRHVGAIADRVLQALKDNGHGPGRVEGLPACDWVLIDAGDVLIHIFRPEVRSFYNLEKMWGADRPLERAAV
jgi:ribosome-associated protein